MPDAPATTMDEDAKIVQEAHKRTDRALELESYARDNLVNDVKFGVGDARNGYQWPDDMRKSRQVDQRPCLTINKTEQHCLQIVNDARQNKAGIKVRAVGDEATFEAAQIFEGIIRHIEYESNAQAAYDTATWWQVFGGIGYFRVLTEYVSDQSFDQEIRIRRVPDPLTVVMDNNIHNYDGSDAKWATVFTQITHDEAKAEYPGADFSSDTLGISVSSAWVDDDMVRVAEYFRKSAKPDTLYALVDGTTVLASDLRKHDIPLPPKEMIEQTRKVTADQVEWFKIVGNKIVDRREWPGKYIPICRVVGQETMLDGRIDRKGHVRALLDPQRMYNYNSSSAIENMSLQTKIPWVMEAAAIEGREEDWENANVTNKAALTYNGWDDQGQRTIAPPQRIQPPVQSAAYMQGMQVAQQEMMMVSGQYQAVMGAQSNETSGKAINARQRQGDNATYHFIDHLAQAIRYCGQIVIDMIPRVYDTPRIVKIMAESGDQATVQLDPNAPAAHTVNGQPGATDESGPTLQQLAQRAQIIFNPNIGRYDIESDVGPAYATQRQEAFNAITQILTQAPQLVTIIGDLLFKSADFPGSDEIAKRLKNMVPPQAMGGPDPQTQQLQGEAQKMQASIVALTQALSDEKRKTADRSAAIAVDDFRAKTERFKDVIEEMRLAKDARDDGATDEYRAETDRMKALAAAIGPEAFMAVAQQAVLQAMQTQLPPIGAVPQPMGVM